MGAASARLIAHASTNRAEQSLEIERFADRRGHDRGIRGSSLHLIVDDDDAVRALVTQVLLRAGYRVTQASDGAKAIAAIRDHTFDAIVLDIQVRREGSVR